MVVNIGATSLDKFLRTLVVMPSGPAAFDGSSFSRIFWTPVFVISMSGVVLWDVSSKGHLTSIL